MLIRRVPLAAAAAVGALALVGCEPIGGDGPGHGYYYTPGEGGEEGGEEGGAEGAAAEGAEGSTGLSVPMLTAEEFEIGTVTLTEEEDHVVVSADLAGLPPGGFHGFHLHQTGQCEPESSAPGEPGETGAFLSAGGHLASEGQDHGAHDGDMPPVRVTGAGTAVMELHLDTVTMADLMDADGTAVMLHAGPDNLANIPDRYAGGPDEETLTTGDSGDRIACGVIEAGE